MDDAREKAIQAKDSKACADWKTDFCLHRPSVSTKAPSYHLVALLVII